MKLMKNKHYLQQKFSRKVLVPQTTADFTLMVSKSYVPFTCKFPIVMYFVLILHWRCRSKPNFYVLVTTKLVKNFVQVSDFSLQYSWKNSKKSVILTILSKKVTHNILVYRQVQIIVAIICVLYISYVKEYKE